MPPIGRSQVIYNGLAIAVVGVAPVKNTEAMTNVVHSSCACESGFLQGEHNNKQQEVRDPGNQVIAIACVCGHAHLCTHAFCGHVNLIENQGDLGRIPREAAE